MPLNFCTLFNAHYLPYGLSLYESLKKHCSDFHLYIYAFDDEVYEYFIGKQLAGITVIRLEAFENDELLGVKKDRSFGEYCWTCTSSIILHAINTFQLDSCTYVDADIYFFSSPQALIDEMGNKSVLITEHRYTKQYDQSKTSGVYCVQFMTFKNDPDGMMVLNWWKDRCIEWCYNRYEDGKFGDQKYLDDWLTRFDCVHSLSHIGGGVAPWNMQQYRLELLQDKIFVTEYSSGRKDELVFFHYHGLKFFRDGVVQLTNEVYRIPAQFLKIIYIPYVRKILAIHKNENRFHFLSKAPDTYFGDLSFISFYNKIRIQYMLEKVKLKQFKTMFSGGNYYRTSALKS